MSFRMDEPDDFESDDTPILYCAKCFTPVQVTMEDGFECEKCGAALVTEESLLTHGELVEKQLDLEAHWSDLDAQGDGGRTQP